MSERDAKHELVGQPFTVCFTVPPAMMGNDAEIAKIDEVLRNNAGQHLARLTDGRAYEVMALPVMQREIKFIAHSGKSITERFLIVLVALRHWRECAVGECVRDGAISEDNWSDQYWRRTRNGFVFVWQFIEYTDTTGLVRHTGIYRRME